MRCADCFFHKDILNVSPIIGLQLRVVFVIKQIVDKVSTFSSSHGVMTARYTNRARVSMSIQINSRAIQ